ncbi:MAG: TetR/AcrR family transcriptional regulator [Actinobacteria bacterium]|nr:TetR/AcrR family transcriptional regulator [Actinomycetota bacterium]
MRKEPGRPRDDRIDAAVLDAATTLLLEVGYADLRVSAVADRAGTTRPAVYRRWPTKAHLVHEAAFRDHPPAAPATAPPPSGSLDDDVHHLVHAVALQLSTPLARAAVPGLLADAAGDPTLHAQLLERFALAGWGGVDARLAAAVERGEARPDVDAGTLLETAIGAALLATFLRGADALDDAWVARTAALLLRGLHA